MRRRLSLIVLLAASLLYGCSVQTTRPGSPAVGEAGSDPEQNYASFEPDTLYDLMVAELGGQRQRYDLALGNYLKQAHKTQDKGVAKRAYQIASYIGAKQAALDAALLWSSLDSEDPIAIKASALELMHSGEAEEAVKRMAQTLSMDPESDFELMATYAAAASDGNKDLLLSAFSGEAKRFPDNRSLLLGKAILLHQMGRNDEALAQCDLLIRKDSEFIKALIIKGRILNKLGRDAEAERMLADAVNRYPDRVRLRLIYARVLVHGNKLDLAREQFEALLQLSPNDGEIILSLGLIAVDNNMADEAEGYFSRLLALGQKSSTANYYLGKLSEGKGLWNKARQYYMSVTPGKEFVMSRVSLTQMLVKQGQWQEARKLLDQSRALYPAGAESLYMLEGEILVKREEFKDARALFDLAVSRYPKSINLLYSRAMVFEKLDRINETEADLREILAMQPDNAVVLNALGYTLVDRTKRLEEAEALIKKAYSLNKEDPAIIDSMGWLHYRLGKLELAQKYLEEAYNKFPDAEVAAHLGEVYWMRGDKDKARVIWKTALQSQPGSKVVIETRQRLEKGIAVTQ
ncbi:tetratricopeptide repeat protein [Endozoicomonas sp. Mp262]|uniref:tetratricopeptide repeat protein n=1 Tax=Endozoicomonas sp. Mp262 TaxID=2919499 RepID=UPI0021DF81F5